MPGYEIALLVPKGKPIEVRATLKVPGSWGSGTPEQQAAWNKATRAINELVDLYKPVGVTYWDRASNGRLGPARDYVSNDHHNADRWRIIHPASAISKRWELWDCKDRGTKWEGDWPTLKAAKAQATLLERQEAGHGRS